MLSLYKANAYALALNIPVASFYSLTAPSTLPLGVSLVIVCIIIGLAIFESFSNTYLRSKLATVAVITGTGLVWSMLLFVYGYVPEFGNNLIYNAADVLIVVGAILILLGVLMAFGVQRAQHFVEASQPQGRGQDGSC